MVRLRETTKPAAMKVASEAAARCESVGLKVIATELFDVNHSVGVTVEAGGKRHAFRLSVAEPDYHGMIESVRAKAVADDT